jgi:hypothetical protein
MITATWIRRIVQAFQMGSPEFKPQSQQKAKETNKTPPPTPNVKNY